MEQQVPLHRVKKTYSPPTDPLWDEQWYLVSSQSYHDHPMQLRSPLVTLLAIHTTYSYQHLEHAWIIDQWDLLGIYAISRISLMSDLWNSNYIYDHAWRTIYKLLYSDTAYIQLQKWVISCACPAFGYDIKCNAFPSSHLTFVEFASWSWFKLTTWELI